MIVRRLMLQLVPAGIIDDPAGALVVSLARAASGTGATLLRRSPDCFCGDAAPFRAAAEFRFDDHRRADAIDTAARIAEKLGDAVDRVRSVAQVGHDVVFVEGDTPVRFQYLMARRHDFTHEEYLDRYETIHSRFGLDTPNIEGYTQFHVDLVASAELAEATGLTGRPSDSVSELHLRSVAHFIEGVTARPDVGRDATRDEERFVDRANSHQFVNEIVARNS